MTRPFQQFDDATEEEILEVVREWRGQRRGGRRAPKRNYGPKGGGGGGLVSWGLVASATAASWSNVDNALTLGELEAYPLVPPSNLPGFSAAASYALGDLIYLTAAPYDADGSYSVGQTALYSGSAYRCTTATSGAWDAGDWALMDTQGVKRATAAISPGNYNGAQWADVVGDEFVDRDADTVTLPLRFTAEPPEGALVGWTAGQIVVLTCDAVEGWA